MGNFVRFAALCLLLSVCAEVTYVAGTCSATDQSALLYFCREFPISYKAFLTWRDGSDCCTWAGVACDGNGNVVGLSIETIDLNPPYPGGPPYDSGTGLLGLKSLTNLTMKNVAFNGQLPDSWGTLIALQVIDLESCNIVGNLPASLCNLKNLIEFSIFGNLFNGALPACYSTPSTTFPKIQDFNISGNSFSS